MGIGLRGSPALPTRCHRARAAVAPGIRLRINLLCARYGSLADHTTGRIKERHPCRRKCPRRASALRARIALGVTKFVTYAETVEHNMIRTFLRYVSSHRYRTSSSMMRALTHGDWQSASTLLLNGADIEFRDQQGRTPLLYAIEMMQSSWVTFLLNIGADPNAKDPKGECAFVKACRTGNVELVQSIVAGGLSVSAPFRVGPFEHITPLHVAVAFGMPRIAEQLLKAGASPTSPCCADGTGSPMEFICVARIFDACLINRDSARDLATVRVLMGAGASINSSIVEFACTEGDEAMLNLVLDAGTSPDGPSGDGSLLTRCLECGREESARLLIRRGANLRLCKAALASALPHCSSDFLRFLTTQGASVDDWDASRGSGFRGPPIIRAVKLRRSDLVRTLLDLGAEVDFTGGDVRTATQAAIYELGEALRGYEIGDVQEAFSVLDLLLDSRTNIDQVTDAGETLAHLLVKEWVTPIRYFTSDLHSSRIHEAMCNLLRRLAQLGCDLGARDKENRGLLHVATRYYGSERIVFELLKYKDVAAQLAGDGQTLVSGAASDGIRRVLISSGAKFRVGNGSRQ